MIAGTEQFSARNAIDQDILELNEAYTLLKGGHTITLGTHNEFLALKNLFIRDNFGTYSFASLDRFEEGFGQQYDRSFSATSNPLQAAEFSVRQWGFHAGDQWRMTSNLTVTYGVRMDAPRYPKKPTANPQAVALFGYATDVVPNDIQWSPRIGANWDVRRDGSEQVRGGLGMFTGRPAYVWISNQFGNTGIDFSRIGASFSTANRIPFVKDPYTQPTTVTGATAGSFTNEIDVIDPNFKYPSILRGNLAYDRKLPWGLFGSAELVWSNTLQDIKYENLNFAVNPAAPAGVGGREFFARQVTSLSDVVLLENTDQGYTWNLSVEMRRPWKNGFTVSGNYSYGVAESIMDGTSDQAASNWGNVYTPSSPNNVPLARSNFDPGHRVALSGSYDQRIYKDFRATLSLFYSGQSGRPFALTTNRDTNGDNRGTNDLLYIPASAAELTFTGGTYADFINFINEDPCLAGYVGTTMPRNACRAPWVNTFDARIAIQLPRIGKVRTDVTADILNVTNVFNQNSGLIQYMSFGQLTQFQPVPTTVTATSPLTGYNISAIMAPTFSRYLYDNLRSRWQLQLGVRARF